MYLEHFGLSEAPFSIAPDPRYLYMSERHREALAHLVYGLNSDGAFILLSGDVGTGKTTVSRCLLEQIPEDTDLALVLNPKVTVVELLETICDELYCQEHAQAPVHHGASKPSVKVLVDIINRFLLDAHARGRKTVLMIDEAQNLGLDVLEQLRLLTNLETNERKLLQIILLGQPELLEMLARPELSQLAQRITARYHLTPLNEKEIAAYISHRLAVAGCRRPLFSRAVLKRIYQLSGGIPRLVNVLCDRALLGTYVQNRQQVNRSTLEQAAHEVFGSRNNHGRVPLLRWLLPASLAAVLLLALVMVLLNIGGHDQAVQLASAVVPPEEVAQVEAVEASISMETSIAWPEDARRLRTNSLAYQELFSRWALDYQPEIDGSPCFFAQTRGLACLHAQGNMQQLRSFNRPVVLELKDDQGQAYYATLIELNQQTAMIKLAGDRLRLSTVQLQRYWYGKFTLLWHQPAGYSRAIHPGYEGEPVVWLSRTMNRLEGKTQQPEMSRYQDELLEQVRRFQLEKGLVADGIVGVQTLIHINNAIGLEAPVLVTKG